MYRKRKMFRTLGMASVLLIAALLLRETLEHDGETAALVTPDAATGNAQHAGVTGNTQGRQIAVIIECGGDHCRGTLESGAALDAKDDVLDDLVGRFYAESEFDLGPIPRLPGNLLELGRTCISPAVVRASTSPVAHAIWIGPSELVTCRSPVISSTSTEPFTTRSFTGPETPRTSIPASRARARWRRSPRPRRPPAPVRGSPHGGS